jgi:hypothetical protein
VPTDVRVGEGGSCTLECQASGTPLPQVTWTKNGQTLQSNDHYTIESNTTGTHRLILRNARHDDGGIYTANVKNKINTQHMNFNVIITGQFDRVVFLDGASFFQNEKRLRPAQQST